MSPSLTSPVELFFGQHRYEDINPLTCGYHHCDPGHTAFGMRQCYMLHYIEEGCGTLYADGRVLPVTRGQCFVVRPYEDVRYIADEQTPWQYVYVNFDGSKAKKLDTLDDRVYAVSAAPFATIRDMVDRKDLRDERILSAIYLVLSELLSGQSTQPHYVRRTVNMIQSSYHADSLSVSRIAEEMNLDRRYLVRLFKSKMGVGIQEYIINVRMENACSLLKNGFNVTTTAAMVGYRDSFNFSKMFKKQFGISPKQFAQRHRRAERG